MGHCIDCGAEVSEDDKFCPECGAGVVKKPATDLQGVRSAAAKKPEKKAEEIPKPKAKPNGSAMRAVVSVLAVLFLVCAVAFFVMVVPKASRMSGYKPPLQEMGRTEDKRCDIGGEMACLDATIHENAVVLSFQNTLGRQVVITKVIINGCEPAYLEMPVAPGERGAVVVKYCSLGGLGSYAVAKVSVQYRLGSQAGEVREANGAIAGIVQAKLRTAAATPTSASPMGEVSVYR